MYCTPSVLKESKSQSSLNKAARSLDGTTGEVSFVLHMTYNVSGGKIASAIGESVKPHYNGHPSHVKDLEKLIIDGVNKKGKEQSLKGTVFGFDCSSIGVKVLVNGSSQGTVRYGGLGEAVVDVFTGAENCPALKAARSTVLAFRSVASADVSAHPPPPPLLESPLDEPCHVPHGVHLESVRASSDLDAGCVRRERGSVRGRRRGRGAPDSHVPSRAGRRRRGEDRGLARVPPEKPGPRTRVVPPGRGRTTRRSCQCGDTCRESHSTPSPPSSPSLEGDGKPSASGERAGHTVEVPPSLPLGRRVRPRKVAAVPVPSPGGPDDETALGTARITHVSLAPAPRNRPPGPRGRRRYGTAPPPEPSTTRTDARANTAADTAVAG
ncbi:hypothetical protein THAOC_12541, partial [Thalassiosira oceanica]